jgi:hypothetical protein
MHPDDGVSFPLSDRYTAAHFAMNISNDSSWRLRENLQESFVCVLGQFVGWPNEALPDFWDIV